ncbi:High potential iron-sulfur protein [Oceanospirillum multiglobuliferum]|uniref:high-potential iron-sulfur protein n=1 Tax=Oceanospirillum multiglobuliferum TaxID=64969 RepID=UPI00099B0DB8|nr:high-potential iron-sulfur protein [Oceanospirillum multiglobuliferum]SJZ63986.1 High potential iron-sulfur protein [Oceanospirillum multiglobuliferum]
MNINRRKFLLLACTAPTIPFISSPVLAAFPVLKERDSAARALHYKADVRDVRHPKYQSGQNCANCQLFNFIDNGCVLFSSNSVSPNGWCQAWVKKV